MTTPKWLDPKISVGNIIAVLSIIVGLSIGYQTIIGSVAANAKDIASNIRRLDAVEVKVDRLFNELQSDRLKLTEALTQLSADVRYLRESIDQMKQRGQ